jgi:predicted dehydrogenase
VATTVTDPIRWGIAAPGHIATKFAEDLALLGDASIVAVASRSHERAVEFGDRFAIPGRYGAYDGLAADPDVDVVYLANLQASHAADAIAFLDAGKHVLCEKPLALNERQVAQMAEAAARNGRFLMEALWSRFLPSYVELRRLLGERVIGDVVLVEADFGFALPVDPAHRLYDLAMGGGCLLDLGIYPLQLATMVLGPAASVAATGHLAETGVDDHTVVSIAHESGGISVSQAAIRVQLTNHARIAGSGGTIELPSMMHLPQHLDVTTPDSISRIEAPFDGNGLRFQAAEVHRCLRAGASESPVMPLAESRRLAAIMDQARAQIGLRYAADD